MNISQVKEKFVEIINKNQSLLIAAGVIFVALFWRLYRINQIPEGLNNTELTLVKYLINVSENGWKIDPNYIHLGIYSYIFSAFGYLTKFNIIYLRILQAVISSSSIFLFYMFTKNWFNRQSALLASLLLATSSFHVLMSRNLEPMILIPIFIISILYLFTICMRTNKIIHYILTGILIGLAFYVDVIFVFLPVVSLVGIAYLYVKKPKALKAYWKGFLAAGIMAITVAIPYFYFLPQNFTKYLSQFNPGSIGSFYLNLGSNIQSLFYQSPLNNIYNVGTEPILDPFISISFICGLTYAIFYLRRKKFLILVSWFLITIFIVSLKQSQSLLNFIVFVPVIYILASIMLDYVLTHWVRTFPFNRAARILMTFAFSLFLFLSIFYNYQKYFWAWGQNQSIQQNYQNKVEYKR